MCIICVDFNRGALKKGEARRALGEMRTTLTASHVKEIEEKLDEADADESAAKSNSSPPPSVK